MSMFNHHKYTWSNPFGSVRHNWEFVGPEGAINFHVGIHDPKYGGPSCGLEFHHMAHAKNRPAGAPGHTNCPLTGGVCWHDGTSLYASEHVWPYVEPMLRGGEHDAIFRYLEGEYRRHFGHSEAADES